MPQKNRTDLRHHAIDAIVVALTTEKRLWHLANAPHRKADDPPAFEPWPGFRNAVEAAVSKINVSHRVQRRIRGQLHLETHYGKPDERGEFPYRKFLTDLTWSEVERIRDRSGRVREIVEARLAKFRKQSSPTGNDDEAGNDDEDSPKRKPPAGAWSEPLFLTHKDGSPATVIKRVRLTKPDQTIRPIREGEQQVFVKPGNTHHFVLFKNVHVPSVEHDRDLVAVPLLDAIERKLELARARKQGRTVEPVIRKTHPKYAGAQFWMSLSKGEMVLLKPDDTSTLYRFETAPATTKQMVFRKHNAAQIGKNGVYKKYPWTLPVTTRKVTVDPLGRIRWAND